MRLAYLRECEMRYKLEDSLAREQRALYLERVSTAGRMYAANQLACPAEEGRWSVAMCLAAQKSSELGQPVLFP